MSTTSLVILLIGAFFVATKGARLARLLRDARADRAEVEAAEIAFRASQERSSVERDGHDAPSNDDHDIGVALALALRDAEADAKGKWSTLDSP